MTHSILHNCDTAEEQITELEAEVERLRAVLREIATPRPFRRVGIRQMAREALDG